MSRNSFIQQLENLCDEYSSKLNELDDREMQILSTCYVLLGGYEDNNSKPLKIISEFAKAIAETRTSSNTN